MIRSLDILTIVTVAVITAAYNYWARIRRMRGSKLPPGPPGLPLLGNILDFPKTEEWLAYKAMSREYGELGSLLETI